MSSGRSPFALRLALWYATVFVVSSLAIVILTYALTARAITQRDQQILRTKAVEYTGAYVRGGLPLLTATVRTEQAVAPERLFVRILDQGVETVVLSHPEGWDVSRVEFQSVQLPDGTLLQVGKSNEARQDLLARLRVALGLVTFLIVLLALAGGWIATESSLLPVRRLSQTVKRIIDTGETDARVPRSAREGHEDEIDQLGLLFNAMLDRIERLVAAMRGSLDNVSHDLRTPLARLRSTAEFALAGPPDADRYREALAECVEETDRTLAMLNTLMDISEAESGAMQLRREPTDLRVVLERAAELYHDVAETRGVMLVPHPAGDTGETLIAPVDRTRLEQVVANLIDNALKYTPRGGRVDVRLGRRDETALIEVQDTGVGIPAVELPRIWERLFRGDRSRSERGLGLGLSLVKAIVEAHGGSVEVRSEVGSGSTFTVSLPLTPPNLSRM